MKNETQQTIEQLKEINSVLISNLKRFDSDEIYEKNLIEIRANEQKIKALNIEKMLNNTNAKYERLRNLAKQAYECEQPAEDITNADGSLHKTKSKKYPKLASLQYANATFENGLMLKLTVNGEKFNMYACKYESGKENTYTRPATFEDFLKLNSIPIKDITIKEYMKMSEKLNKLNKQLEENIKAYSEQIKDLNVNMFNYWGLINQYNKHVYEYTPKTIY
jgi:hypothetical protein